MQKKQLSTAKSMIKEYSFYKSGHVLSIKSYLKDNWVAHACL